MAADLSSALVALKSRDDGINREYRKGNWTMHETMVLIAAKKLDDERRLRGGCEKEKGRSTELRWKWVENYCWKNECERSQNQCNDKWDNLLRDYKKVREHEATKGRSYWQLERQERKSSGLPSNLLIQVYDALHEIVEKKQLPAPSPHAMFIRAVPTSDKPCSSPPPSIPQPAPAEESKSSESEGRNMQGAVPKRRRLSSTTGALMSAIKGSTSELSQALLACEEKKDKRHKDLLDVEERKLLLEHSRVEINRQGFENLILAVNSLASSILTLAADHRK